MIHIFFVTFQSNTESSDVKKKHQRVARLKTFLFRDLSFLPKILLPAAFAVFIVVHYATIVSDFEDLQPTLKYNN